MTLLWVMRAARFRKPGEPMKVEHVTVRLPKPDEVIVKVEAAGICGTDVHIAIEGTIPTAKQPITLGHEAAGVIGQVGREVKGWKRDDRVIIYPQISCLVCASCRSGKENLCLRARIFGLHIDGAFAEYLTLPESCLVKLPDGVPFEQGAIIPDAVSTPYHAVITRGQLKPGESVAVFGCGGLGIHGIKIARAAGASKIIAVDVHEPSLEHASRAGADHTVDASKEDAAKSIRKLASPERGVNMAVEFVGSPKAIETAAKSLIPGGRLIVCGIGEGRPKLPHIRTLVGAEMEVKGSMGSTRDDLQNVLNMISAGKLDIASSITDTIKLEEINEGFNKLHKKEGSPIRTVVKVGSRKVGKQESRKA